MQIDFQTHPSQYHHWQIAPQGAVAELIMDVDETSGLFDGYELKLNSYDLGVDIELYDALQRLRFEYPEVKVIVLRSAKERVFCAGANIKMLAGASHAHKVNFCKFTNETRNSMEDASRHSQKKFIAAVSGSCAGGGYELALACDQILLTDDGSSSVSLPEVPLLGVLPGTGGLTRVTDKRKVRKDLADIFSTLEEGVRGSKAVKWRLVDAVAVNSKFQSTLDSMVQTILAASDNDDSNEYEPACQSGIRLHPIQREFDHDVVRYSTLTVTIDRPRNLAMLHLTAPDAPPPEDLEQLLTLGDQYWGIRAARELDDALLHLRFNETEIGILQFTTQGQSDTLFAHEQFLAQHNNHWLAKEIQLNWARVLRRIDLTARSLVALIEPTSCFVGLFMEIALACDRIFMALGEFEDAPNQTAAIKLSQDNFTVYPMANGLSRLATRFYGEPEILDRLEELLGEEIDGALAEELGLITYGYDDIDWEDEIRIFIEERGSFSPDALTGMEANLRFAGPETMETKIFGRLTAWQNWIFQRPNAAGEEGALTRYGSGRKANFNPERV